MSRNRRPTARVQHTPATATEGRITVDQVMLVSRNAKPCQVRGTDYALTIDELIKTTARGDWESGYYQLTTAGAGRAARDINTKLQAKGKESVTA